MRRWIYEHRCYVCGDPIARGRPSDCGHPLCRKVMEWTHRRRGWPRWVACGTEGFHLRAAVYFVECMAKPRTATDWEFAKRYHRSRPCTMTQKP